MKGNFEGRLKVEMRNMKKVRISRGTPLPAPPNPSAFFDLMTFFSGLHSILALIKSNNLI